MWHPSGLVGCLLVFSCPLLTDHRQVQQPLEYSLINLLQADLHPRNDFLGNRTRDIWLCRGNVLALRRHMLKYFWVKHDEVCNLFSNGSEKKMCVYVYSNCNKALTIDDSR